MTTQNYYDSDYVIDKLDSFGRQTLSGTHHATVHVGIGESAWNPSSTKPDRRFFGPCIVSYTRRGGSISAVRD